MAKLHVPILVDWDDIKDLMAIYDIVEVVRCQHCTYAVEDDSDPTRYWCSYKWPANMVPDNGFCFRGDHK